MDFLGIEESNKAKVIPFRDKVVLAQGLNEYAEKGFDFAGDAVESTGLWEQEIKARMDNKVLKALFYTDSWTFILTDLIANKISAQPLKVVTRTIQDGKEVFEPNEDHPLNLTIKQPNPWQDYHAWMYNTVVEDVQMGNAIMWWAKKNGHLITLPADNINLHFDNKQVLSRYDLSDEGGEGTSGTVAHFPADEIIHIRRPNPNSLLWGLSPYVPGGANLLFNRYTQDYLNSFYLKQALPGMALSIDKSVNESVALRQLRSFELAHTGRKNQRRTLILPKGVSAQTLTHTLSDQKLVDMIDKNRETIMGLLKVPKHELSLQEAGSLGSEEHKIALRNFWESTLIPITRRIEGGFNKFFEKELEGENVFKFDLSAVEALKDDLKKKAETAKAMLEAGLSINEVRTEVWQVKASTASGADDPFVLTSGRIGAQQITLSTHVPETKQVEAPNTKINVGEYKEFRDRYCKQLDEEEQGNIKSFGIFIVGLLSDMIEAAVMVVADSDKTKALPKNRVLEKKILDALRGFEESYFDESTSVLSSSVDLGYDSQLDLIFNPQNLNEINTLRSRDENNRRLSLEARSLEAFDSVSKTTTEKIMRVITEGAKDGLSTDQIIINILDRVAAPEITVSRAETIARTETLTAVSIGQAAAAKNAAEVIPGLKKGWLTVGDDRVRDSHAAVDGELVGTQEKFSNGLLYPRDTRAGDASDVINCRCTLILVPPGEDLKL